MRTKGRCSWFTDSVCIVVLQEFSGEDNSDLYLEEREQAIQRAQTEKHRMQLNVPGIIGPHDLPEEMQDWFGSGEFLCWYKCVHQRTVSKKLMSDHVCRCILCSDNGRRCHSVNWRAPWKNRIYWYISFFHPSLNHVLFPLFCLLMEGECQILVF